MKDNNRVNDIDNWKKAIFSKDRKTALHAVENLSKTEGEDVFIFLIGLLELEDSGIRDLAGLALRDLKDNRAVEPLFKAILKPENINYNGTLVYALETLDCKDQLVNLFRILFYQSYESKMGASTILNKQVFEFDRDDLMEIHRMWKDCTESPDKANGFEDEETMQMIQDAYSGFMEYLDK